MSAVKRAQPASEHERQARTDSGGVVFVRADAGSPEVCEKHPDQLAETCAICTKREVRRG